LQTKVECLSTREYNMREELSEVKISKAQWRFNVLDFTKKTKSEATVAFIEGLIYEYKRTSHTTLRRCVMICGMHLLVHSKVMHRLQKR